MATDDAKTKHKAAIQRQQNSLAGVAATSTPNSATQSINSTSTNNIIVTSTPVFVQSSDKITTTDNAITPPQTVQQQQPLLDSINTNSSNSSNCSTPASNTNECTTPMVSSSGGAGNHHQLLQQGNTSENIENVAGQGHFQHTTANLSPSACRVMPSSVSSTSITMGNEKLANIHLNTTNPTSSLDVDEIGHGIPTPECLPQSRKHSIVQSKLATPRLSTSSS
jgi:hypothetical protein